MATPLSPAGTCAPEVTQRVNDHDAAITALQNGGGSGARAEYAGIANSVGTVAGNEGGDIDPTNPDCYIDFTSFQTEYEDD